MTDRVPAEVFPPGEFIRDELEARGWTQQDLAQILDRPLVAVNQIITGKRAITPETAKGLASAFGTSADVWLNMESAYQLSQIKTEESDVSDRAKLYTIAPVGDMIKRGWIDGAHRVGALRNQLERFYNTDDLDKLRPLEVAARKSGSYAKTEPVQLAWYYRAYSLARSAPAAKYDRNALISALPKLRALTQHPENIERVPAIMSALGIRFVLIEALQRSRLDGAAFWLDDDKPAVVLTLRYDRIDGFWHTLIHELIHIKNGDKRSIDADLVGGARGTESEGKLPELEERTNAEACNTLVSREKLDGFIFRTKPLYSKKAIIRFAQANEVHPGIVVGQLQHRREIPWTHSREMLVPVRHYLIGLALTDGWGHTPGTTN
jgi:HTH-type transcriptional regulator / antitoxin HigA